MLPGRELKLGRTSTCSSKVGIRCDDHDRMSCRTTHAARKSVRHYSRYLWLPLSFVQGTVYTVIGVRFLTAGFHQPIDFLAVPAAEINLPS